LSHPRGKAPEGWCRHRIAAGIAKRVRELLAAEAPQAPTQEQPRGAPRCPLGEAPASVNVRAMLAGHECQLTLRDHDEGALLLRPQAVLKRPDVQPVPRPAPRAGQWKKREYAGR